MAFDERSSRVRTAPAPTEANDRRRVRSCDPEIALSIAISSLRERFEVDALVLADFDGTPVSGAGDDDDIRELAELAAATAKESPGRTSLTTTRGFVQVALAEVRGRRFIVAALSKHGTPSPAAMARAVGGVTRILRGGLTVATAAPIPLVSPGWGDWSKVPMSGIVR